MIATLQHTAKMRASHRTGRQLTKHGTLTPLMDHQMQNSTGVTLEIFEDIVST